MVAYSLTPGDVERGGGEPGEEKTVVLVQEKKPSLGWILKLFGALFLVALCLGAVLVVVWTWNLKGEALVQPGKSEAQVQTTPDKTDPHSTLKKISSKAKAAIHLEGIYEDGVHSRLEWRSGQGQAFAQGGFVLQNNKIVIPESGLYFVYSQASFRVSCDNNQNNAEEDSAAKRRTPLSHRIWRFSESIGSDTSLMSAIRSACSQSLSSQEEEKFKAGQGWYNAIYLGAVFQLNRGDRLWTETNQLSELETEEGKTFFGVFALF